MECLSALLLAGFAASGPSEILEFSGPNCPPCLRMKPLVQKLKSEGHPIRVFVYRRYQSNPEFTRYGIQRFPTFVLIKNGREINRTIGMMSESTLRSWLKQIEPVRVADAKPTTNTKSLGNSAPFPGGASSVPAPSPGAFSATPRSTLPLPGPLSATVRIRVQGVSKQNQGAGTVIRSSQKEAIVLTAAHLFYKDIQRATGITVDVFSGSQFRSLPASLIEMNKQADVAVIRVQTTQLLDKIKIAEGEATPAIGTKLGCIGCGGGKAPSKQEMEVTRINAYSGPQNIECTTMPIEGRSGGGLFNARGELVGVCIAANQKMHRGVYIGLKPIRALILAAKIDAAPAKPEPPPFDPPGSKFVDTKPMSPAPTISKETSREGSILQPSQPPVKLNGDSEVICIVRPINNPDAQSRVVIINKASQKFVRYLNLELDDRPKPTSRALPLDHKRKRIQRTPRQTGQPQRYIRRVW